MIGTDTLHSPAWDTHPLVQARVGWWSAGFGGQTQGEDQDWLHRDSLKRLECGNWGCTRKKPGPTREARRYGWEAHKKRGGTTIGASFPVRVLSGSRTPPTWAPGAAWAAAAIMGSRGRHGLPPPLRDTRVGANHCPHHQGRVQGQQSGENRCPCCRRSVWATADAKRWEQAPVSNRRPCCAGGTLATTGHWETVCQLLPQPY